VYDIHLPTRNCLSLLTSQQAGRISLPIALELNKNGYQVTILTRDATRLADLPEAIKTQRVDYDSDFMLARALHGQDALVSTVAMSAISHQPRLIEAAIAAGAKYFIPAEYTVNSRDAAAQAQPMMASVVAVQKYLALKKIRSPGSCLTVALCWSLFLTILSFSISPSGLRLCGMEEKAPSVTRISHLLHEL
jgi:hypothetical protein